MQAIRSSETLVHTRSTKRDIPEDGILHSHRRENLKSYIWNTCLFHVLHSIQINSRYSGRICDWISLIAISLIWLWSDFQIAERPDYCVVRALKRRNWPITPVTRFTFTEPVLPPSVETSYCLEEDAPLATCRSLRPAVQQVGTVQWGSGG
jgi:hypothetical protein